MSASALLPDDTRADAARIATALLRFEEPMAHPLNAHTPDGMPAIGVDAWTFVPSWQPIPLAEVVPFLVGLPSPALLSPTTTRGMIALMLVHELSGDRRRWAEKTLQNFTDNLDASAHQLGLEDTSPVLLDLPDETLLYPLATFRTWTREFGVQVGWTLWPLAGDVRARTRFAARRSDGTWSHTPPRG